MLFEVAQLKKLGQFGGDSPANSPERCRFGLEEPRAWAIFEITETFISVRTTTGRATAAFAFRWENNFAILRIID